MLPRRRLLLAGSAIALGGCATRFYADGEQAQPRLEMQNPGLNPRNGGVSVGSEALRPGDILLSSAAGLHSLGIRVVTLSPVSHASLYIGNAEVAEAVSQGVQRRTLEKLLDEEQTVVAFRHPLLTADHLPRMRDFVAETVGQRYNLVGVMLQAPFSIERRMCELPLTPSLLRDFCLQGVGAVQLGLGRNDRFFCSQFVLEAYRRAGLPLTDADPRLLGPQDLLHMREGDVPSVRSNHALQYIGHLKFAPSAAPIEAPPS